MNKSMQLLLSSFLSSLTLCAQEVVPVLQTGAVSGQDLFKVQGQGEPVQHVAAQSMPKELVWNDAVFTDQTLLDLYKNDIATMATLVKNSAQLLQRNDAARLYQRENGRIEKGGEVWVRARDRMVKDLFRHANTYRSRLTPEQQAKALPLQYMWATMAYMQSCGVRYPTDGALDTTEAYQRAFIAANAQMSDDACLLLLPGAFFLRCVEFLKVAE